MPLKMSKSKTKISQKVVEETVKKPVYSKISKNTGEKQTDDERMDLGTSPTDELSESVVNQYGLTTRRPTIMGLFDFNPLFNHQLGPTDASRMFDLQAAATDFSMGQSKRMHNVYRKATKRNDNIYGKRLERRFAQKMHMANDLTNTLDNVHGLIRLITDETDVKKSGSTTSRKYILVFSRWF